MSFAMGEYLLGTDAIRYLNNNYYADEHLLPSLFYIFGLVEHEEWPESEKYESDPDAEDDMVID